MSRPWYEVPNPMAGHLGYSNRATPLPPLAAPPAPPMRKVSIEDAYLRVKPRVRQQRGRNGEVSPNTLRGRVLLAMCKLAGNSVDTPVHDADIIYTAWELWPDVFGLSGYACPDASKARAKICGPEGLIGREMVVRVHEGVYRLTQKAVNWAESV